MQTTLIIKGTHCKSCKILIEDVCKEIKGAKACTVNFENGETNIKHDESFDWQAFKKEVEGLGNYTVNLNTK
jgi:copper chaperone CopZ